MLTYAERIKSMRDTKIRHTLEKRKQNGYTDMDDFGTVPISGGYCVEPWYNSTSGSFYGYDGMCENFCRVIDAHEPYVDPMEMLCGRWRDMLVNYRGDLHYMPDWLKNNLKNIEFIKNGATNQCVRCLIKNKNGWPRFCNDKALCEGYMKNGIDKKNARERIAVGCNWMCVPGREFPMNDTVKINIAKVFTEALADLKTEENKSNERLFELYEKHLKKAIEITAQGINLHLDHVWEVSPELIMNLMMKNILETGCDSSQAAEIYTIGVDGAGLAVVADSFGAIEERIEREEVLNWEELFDALDSNFSDERTRLILNSTPKYCSGRSAADEWAKRLTKSWVTLIKAQKMPKGRMLVPGWFSWSRTIEYGSKVGATPNGRRAGEPISHGANPNPHFRADGAPTAQSNGIASVQCGYGNTAPLQIEFDPHVKCDDAGVESVLSLIEGHFEQGGTLININVLDGEKLMAANKNPDLYPDLVVRVTGFTAYFASLSPQFRRLVVDRFLDNN